MLIFPGVVLVIGVSFTSIVAGLQITSPKQGDVIDPSQPFIITWTIGSSPYNTNLSIYLTQPPDFRLGLQEDQPVTSMALIVFQLGAFVSNGQGYQVTLESYDTDYLLATSGQFSMSSTGGMTMTSTAGATEPSGSNDHALTTTITTAVSIGTPLVTTTFISAIPSPTSTEVGPGPETAASPAAVSRGNDNGLTVGDKVGIGIGVSGAFILLVAILLICYRRKNRRGVSDNGPNPNRESQLVVAEEREVKATPGPQEINDLPLLRELAGYPSGVYELPACQSNT